jgi:hypothetical protein
MWASVTDDMLAETLERQGKGEEAQGVREEGQRLPRNSSETNAKAKDVKKETKRYIMFIAIDKSQLGGTSQTRRSFMIPFDGHQGRRLIFSAIIDTGMRAGK